MIIKYGLILILLVLPLSVVAYADSATETPIKFSKGQDWSIRSSPPTSAKVIIGRVERWHGKVVVHVSLVDVPNGVPAGQALITIAYMPFDEEILSASVDRLLATGIPPSKGFEDSYEQWKKDKSAGVFTISVSKAIETTMEAFKVESQ